MLAVGLTGGIGAGKSTVAELLVGHGAVLVDADRIAREVVAPGGPAYQPMIDRFGPEIVDAQGGIDRPKVAALVFGHPDALADLNAITHPAIGMEMIARRDRFADTDDIVILDIPLLRPIHRETLELAAVIVVDTPTELALERVVAHRGYGPRGRPGPHRLPVRPSDPAGGGRPGGRQLGGPGPPQGRGGPGLDRAAGPAGAAPARAHGTAVGRGRLTGS